MAGSQYNTITTCIDATYSLVYTRPLSVRNPYDFPLLTELGQLSGVAAILRFPLPEIDEDSQDSDSDG